MSNKQQQKQQQKGFKFIVKSNVFVYPESLSEIYYIDFDQNLGEGHFGKVFRAYKYSDANLELAVKMIPVESIKMKDTSEQQIKTEVSCLKILSDISQSNEHFPYFVKHYDSCVSKDYVYIFMELCNQGDLLAQLKIRKYFTEIEVWRILKQIAQACVLLHQNKIIHRDLKPNNIMIHNGIYKIGDPGIAVILNKRQEMQYYLQINTQTFPIYMAPEVKQGIVTTDGKGDVFSLGVICFTLLYGRELRDQCIDFYNKNWLNGNPIRLQFPETPKVSEKMKTILQAMLESDVTKRIASYQIIQEFPSDMCISTQLNQINVDYSTLEKNMNENLSEFMGKCMSQTFRQSTVMTDQKNKKEEIIKNINDKNQIKESLKWIKQNQQFNQHTEQTLISFANIFLFHREVYNFIGRVVFLIDDMHKNITEKIENAKYLKLFYIIQKTQLNYIASMKDRIMQCSIQLIEPIKWGQFLNSKYYKNIVVLLTKDSSKVQKRLEQISQNINKFIQVLQQKTTKQYDFSWFMYFPIDQHVETPDFVAVRTQTIKEILQEIGSNEAYINNRQFLILMRFLISCMNIEIEFSQYLNQTDPILNLLCFIDKIELQMSDRELYLDIVNKLKTLMY